MGQRRSQRCDQGHDISLDTRGAAVRARFDDADRAHAKANGLDVEAVSLQELIVALTTSNKMGQLTKEISR